MPSLHPVCVTIPSQRLFSTSQAAEYLGVSRDTMRKYADLNWIRALKLERRRVFTLEDLNQFIDTLPSYEHPGYTVGGERPGGEEVEDGN